MPSSASATWVERLVVVARYGLVSQERDGHVDTMLSELSSSFAPGIFGRSQSKHGKVGSDRREVVDTSLALRKTRVVASRTTKRGSITIIGACSPIAV